MLVRSCTGEKEVVRAVVVKGTYCDLFFACEEIRMLLNEALGGVLGLIIL